MIRRDKSQWLPWLLAFLFAAAILAWGQSNTSQPIGVKDSADGSTGAAPPSTASLVGYRNSSNMVAPIVCDKNASATAAAVASTQLVALSGSTVIYVCNITIQGTGAAGTAKVVYGTGTTCGTGTTTLVTPWTTAVGTTFSFGGGGASSPVMQTAAGNALCLTMATTSATANYFVSYAQF